MTPNAGFPNGFLWGAATSAYQIEGSPLADGAGPSNWHRFAHTPGQVIGGDTGDVACDHYNRYLEDVALMRSLSLNAYRFSVSWSRVLPEGIGRANEKGLDFYRRLVDALLGAGIQPFGTLFHWDLPAALEDRGGFLNRDVAGWFADYASVVCRALPGVGVWATLNEPWVVMDGGFVHGIHAPGHRSLFEAPVVAHNLLRAHGAAVSACRAEGDGRLGLVVNLEPKFAASESPADIAAAARADAYMNRQFLDPVLLGKTPRELPGIFGEAWNPFPASDFDLIRTPIDFLGINYYTRSVVKDDPEAFARASRVRQDGALHTEMDWEVYGPGLLEVLTWVKSRYGDIPL
ncbi:MAG: family 1 glycosylhydrolase, partial [Acidobacteriota bacterium]